MRHAATTATTTLAGDLMSTGSGPGSPTTGSLAQCGIVCAALPTGGDAGHPTPHLQAEGPRNGRMDCTCLYIGADSIGEDARINDQKREPGDEVEAKTCSADGTSE